MVWWILFRLIFEVSRNLRQVGRIRRTPPIGFDHRRGRLLALAVLIVATNVGCFEFLTGDYPKVEELAQPGRGIQRTMTLLETSTTSQRNSVRILFYGQSITEQNWSDEIATYLQARYPHANLEIENRALGGFASQRLVKTAETDLYTFQPDLMIFHVYGSHHDYKRIIRRARERTTAEILIQTDHVEAEDNWRQEPTDPASIGKSNWPSFMNYRHLPAVAEQYGCGIVDQRNQWKKYLAESKLEPSALLKDDVHLNDAGCRVMAKIVKTAFVKLDDVNIDPMNCGYVQTYVVGRHLEWNNGRLTLEFDGSRVDLISPPKPRRNAQLSVKIDGKPPSAHPELYALTRALPKPGGKWPVIADIDVPDQPLLEEWTLKVRADPKKPGRYAFTVRGSKTGADGEGFSDRRFVSPSGRVVIDPDDWDVEYAMKLADIEPPPKRFEVRWKVVPRYVDNWMPQPIDPNIENAKTIAHGLEDGPHKLEVTGEVGDVVAVRVYSPRRFPVDAQH